MQRREFMTWLAAGAASVALPGCAGSSASARGARVVVVGGGFGGATAAKYVRKWAPGIDVTLVEPNAAFVSCPISNLVLAGERRLEDITVGYGGLAKHGVKVVRDEATAVDPERRELRLARGDPLPYDRLILAPGIDLQFGAIEGLNTAEAQERAPHAWKAGPQTLLLRERLQQLPDGGVVAIHVPMAPYRCPPGPYERASLIAHYLRKAKPRSKLLLLDANADIVSKKGLFQKAWEEFYPGIIEYRPNSELVGYDARTNTAKLQFENVKADLFNIIPPQRAGRIAAPFVTVNQRWCGVDFRSFESVKVPGVHILGDAIAAAPAMPKSGFMANNHAKVAADAVVALLSGGEINPAPVIANTCYSFVSARQAVHVASVHKWDEQQKTLVAVAGAGGLSSASSEPEAEYAHAWARNIWADALG